MNKPSSSSLETIDRLEKNVSSAILGKEDAVRLAVVGLLMRGHVLLEDVPGVGKTLLAKSLAQSIGGGFGRVQFTADLLPADVTGSAIYSAPTESFVFKEGPIFANVLLADELNRASPRTQSSLLEAMNEAQVTVDGVTRRLPEPFLVIATQNPVEHEGTYALPASQLDRFAISLKLGYPSPEWEKEILKKTMSGEDIISTVDQVVTMEGLRDIQAAASLVHVDASITDYVVRLVQSTREAENLQMGASPRGAIYLHRAGMAAALLDGRDYCIPDDVKRLAQAVLAHRIVLTDEALSLGLTRDGVIAHLLESVPVPT